MTRSLVKQILLGAAGVAKRGDEILQVLLILEAGVIYDPVADLTPERSPGRERFYEDGSDGECRN